MAQARITADQDKLDLATARYQMERARLEASKQAIASAMEGQKSKIDLGLAEEKVKVQEVLAKLGIEETIRPERLTVDKFVELSRAFRS